MKSRLTALLHSGLLLILVATLVTSATEAQSRLRWPKAFRQGDLYLCSRSLPDGAAGYQGVVRIDRTTGTVGPLFGGPGIDFSTPDANMIYDPFRDRLLVAGSLNGLGGLYRINVQGRYGVLGFAATPACMAATGDGRVYISYSGLELWCLDSAGVMTLVLDSAGNAQFQSTVSLQKLFYDSSTNSLINTFSDAACGISDDTIIFHRIPLSADGGQVIATESLVETCIVGRSNGICHGPNGQLFMTFDNNTGAATARMLTLSPFDLSQSVFACNGPYLGAGASNAGTYSPFLGRAVLLDTFNDVLRAFDYDPACTENNDGLGYTLATGVSGPGGSGEKATLVVIE